MNLPSIGKWSPGNKLRLTSVEIQPTECKWISIQAEQTTVWEWASEQTNKHTKERMQERTNACLPGNKLIYKQTTVCEQIRVGVQSVKSTALIWNWNARNALQVQFCISVGVHVFHVGEICRDRANVGDSDPDCGKIVTMWGISGFWLEPNPNAAGTPSTRFWEWWS